jgi:cyclohexadieny/prephenate dehydrogenase
LREAKVAQRITIIGGGLIGASLALALRETGEGPHVSVVEPDDVARRRLEAMAVADAIEAELVGPAALGELIVIAAPVSAMAPIARRLAGNIRNDAVVTDACSVKAAVLRDLQPLIASGAAVVPAHPLAGGHLPGPFHARADLFAGKRCILCPPAETGDHALAAVEAFWRSIGMTIDIMSAEQHDTIMALTSHLPHLVAFATMTCARQAEQALATPVLRYAASGFRDFTRIAGADPALWRDILRENRKAVLDTATRLSGAIADLTRALDADDASSIEALLAQASAARRSLAA